MQLVKLSLAERIDRAARDGHGLRLDNKEAKNLVQMYEQRGRDVPARFKRATDKGQGLRIDAAMARIIKSDFTPQAEPAPAQASA